jgi:hypothetical protein
MRSVPICPVCGQRYTMVLVEDLKVRCVSGAAGGCGEEFAIHDYPRLYSTEDANLPRTGKAKP